MISLHLIVETRKSILFVTRFDLLVQPKEAESLMKEETIVSSIKSIELVTRHKEYRSSYMAMPQSEY